MTDDRVLRIAIFGESYLPYLSGVTVATEALARGLRSAGHEVMLVVPRPGGDAAPGSAGGSGPEPRYAWLPSYQGPFPAPAGYRMPWLVPSAALRAAAAFGPDIVHAQSPFVSGLMARRLARRAGAALVFTHHTRFGDYRHYLGPLARPGAAVMAAYLRRWWAGCAAIVAPGRAIAVEIRAALPPIGGPLVRTIPTGVDVAWVGGLRHRDPRVLAGWPPDAVVVVSVGRLAPEKNLATLVEAVALAADREPRLRLLLVGGGPLAAWVADRSRAMDLAGRVHVTGLLGREEALQLASGADLFAFASQTETQGLVVAEALAAGLPVVALGGPGVDDTMRDGIDGTRVDPHPTATSAERLAAAIGALAGDPERRASLGNAAREGARRFSPAERIGQVTALYRELLASRPQARGR